MVIGNHQTAVLPDFDLKPAVQFYRLGDIVQNGIVFTLSQSLYRYNVGLDAGTKPGIRMLLQ